MNKSKIRRRPQSALWITNPGPIAELNDGSDYDIPLRLRNSNPHSLTRSFQDQTLTDVSLDLKQNLRGSRQGLAPIVATATTPNQRIPTTQKNMRQFRYSTIRQSNIRQKNLTTFTSTEQSSDNWQQLKIENSNEYESSNLNSFNEVPEENLLSKTQVDGLILQKKLKVKRIQPNVQNGCNNSIKSKMQQIVSTSTVPIQDKLQKQNYSTRPVSPQIQKQNPQSNQLNVKKQQISYDMITPELAAQIVKNYLLPMFDHQQKSQSQIYKDSRSVVESLHLIVQLQQTVEKQRSELINLTEEFEENRYEKQLLQKQMVDFKRKYKVSKQQNFQLLEHLNFQVNRTMKLQEYVEILDAQYNFANNYSFQCSQSLMEIQNSLLDFQRELETTKQQNVQLTTTIKLNQAEAIYLKSNYQNLVKSFENMALDYKQQKIQKNLIDQLTFRLNQQSQQISQLQDSLGELTLDRNESRDELKHLNEAYSKAQKLNRSLTIELNSQIKHIQDKFDRLKGNSEHLLDKHVKLEACYKMAVKEKDALKMKVIRFSNNKTAFRMATKTCKNCFLEFKDNENNNWSCRFHTSEWGGTVWWCCGKNNKNQPGCKFDKHRTKEEPDADVQESQGDQTGEKINGQKITKCYCCKQTGHSIEKCTMDPNLKTASDIEFDEIRLLSAANTRKLHIDSQVSTTHLFKKAVMLPREESEEGVDTNRSLFKQKNFRSQSQAFTRGIMQFDDYSYTALNQHVLLKQPKSKSKMLDDLEARLNLNKKQGPQKRTLSQEDLRYVELTSRPFEQQALTIESSKIEQISIKTSSESLQQSSNDQSVEEKQPSVQDSDQSKFMYEMYFNENEIEDITKMQNLQVFDALIEMRNEARISAELNAIEIKTQQDVFAIQTRMTKKKIIPPKEIEVYQQESSESEKSDRQIELQLLKEDIQALINVKKQVLPKIKKQKFNSDIKGSVDIYAKQVNK